MRIDAHQQFCSLAPPRRDFLPADLVGHLRRHRIGRTVLVQQEAALAGTEFLLSLARTHDFIGGVVGWVDLGDPASVGPLERFAEDPKFLGVRPMLGELPDADWLARGPQHDVMHALVRLDLCLDVPVHTRHLEALSLLMRRWPELRVVIDHAGNPPIAQGRDAMHNHADLMQMLAMMPRCHCKLSGLLAALPERVRQSRVEAVAWLRPVWDTVLQSFSPSRLMWGSDWPMVAQAADFDTWIDTSDMLIGELSDCDAALVWHDTACAFFGIGAASVPP